MDFTDVDRSDPRDNIAAEDDRCLTTDRPSDDECDPDPVEEEDEEPGWTPAPSCQCTDCRREICDCDGCLFGGSCVAKANERRVA